MKRKAVIPKDTRYVPLTQQPYCCVPTCIQIIMLRHSIPLQSAELMAHHMAIVVAPEKKKLFWNLPSMKKCPVSGYGTKLSENLTANPMFKKLKIPLRMNFNLIDSFNGKDELMKYLSKRVKTNKDTIICYDYGTLFNTGRHSGHVCVLDRVDTSKGEVRFIDPESNVPKWRTVKVSKLYKAMKNHGGAYMAGCWEVTKI